MIVIVIDIAIIVFVIIVTYLSIITFLQVGSTPTMQFTSPNQVQFTLPPLPQYRF